jgi:predicted thioredoxin/glutaredoxin
MAIEKGVFGVPTVIVDGNLFWGNDQMGHLELLLSGQDPLDRDKLTALQNRPRAIDRKAFQEHGADGT